MLEQRHTKNESGELLFELLRSTLERKMQRERVATALLTEKQVREEHKTIKINLGRQAGHTTASAKLFDEYKNILIITNNEELAQHTRERLGDNYISNIYDRQFRDELNEKVLSESAVLKAGPLYWTTLHTDGSKMMPDIVILDCASYSQLSESKLWKLFPEMQYLIMLS